MLSVCLTSAAYKPAEHTEDLEVLLSLIAGKNKDALALLYQKTSSAVYSFALSILKHRHDAEDVLHDAFVNIWSAAGHYHSQGKPMAWIMTVTRNLCLLKLRERKRISDIPEEDVLRTEADSAPDPGESLLLRQILTLLTEEEQQIVTLHAVAGFKHREIAAFLDLPLPTVLSKYTRALKKLKKELAKGEV